MKRLVRVLPTGEVRKLFETRDRDLGFIPRRASHINVVEDGPMVGRFFVDLSLISGEPVCLADTFLDEEGAKAAERSWIERHWILEGLWDRSQG